MVIALSSPLHVGIYEEGYLIEAHQSEDKTSEALPKLFQELMSHYAPLSLLYAKGPGSFMAIKISYLFLKTMSIVYQIPFLGTDGFTFNEGRPIRALRHLYFIKEEGVIQTVVMHEPKESLFSLPSFLDKHSFSEDNQPLYVLPAV